MSFKRLRNAKKALWFRLTLWYSTLFFLSSLLLFVVIYYFLSATLLKQNRDAILSEVNEVSVGYMASGMPALEKEMEIIRKSRKKQPYFIRVAGAGNNTLEIFFPYQWTEFDLKTLEGITPHQGKWTRIPARDEEHFLEVYSTRLPDGNWLQVGLSTEDRQKVLDRFREIFSSVTVLMVLIGFTTGILLALRALKPIQKMILTVQSVALGEMGSRVPRTGAGDELDDLARLFNEMLEKIETLINAMKCSLDNVAHDLRTPLTRLRNKAEQALQVRGDEERHREAFAGCIEETERILRILNTLMDITEAESGIMRLDKRRTNITALLQDIVEFYLYVAEESDLSMSQHIEEGLYALADPDRTGQALANLLDNAVKYTPPGGRISIEAMEQAKEIVVCIKDNGVGIPPDALPRIWDRLYRADPSRSKPGLGLGLTLVKAIIEAHGGRIDVRSEPEKGAAFTIYLPTGE